MCVQHIEEFKKDVKYVNLRNTKHDCATAWPFKLIAKTFLVNTLVNLNFL